MGEEVQELQPDINAQKTEPENTEINNNDGSNDNNNDDDGSSSYKWWLQLAIYSFFSLAGQSVGTLLGRLYFDNGGNSKWLATLVQVVGFPILFPFRWITTRKENHAKMNTKQHSSLILPTIYVALGIFIATIGLLHSVGLQYLPVTTYTLICATQLAFNALFSYFINGQKFTPYIVNSIVLLTISSILLVFQNDPGDSNKTSKRKYVIGFMCTLVGSASYALVLSATRFVFQKIIKKETLKAVIDLSIYQNLVSTIAIVIGLFASGEWRKLKKEMEEYKLGQVSYVMNLFWISVSWQAFGVGCNGLIFKVSALFCNVISILGMPIAPVLAVIFLRDKLTGLKAVAMVVAMWGFVSYMYQHYLEDMEEKKKMKKECSDEEECEVAVMNERGLHLAQENQSSLNSK